MQQINEYKRNHNIRNRQDVLTALKHFGITNDFLSNTGGLAKNPVVQKIASALGADIGKIQEDIRSLISANTNAVSQQNSDDPLKAYRDTLNKLK